MDTYRDVEVECKKYESFEIDLFSVTALVLYHDGEKLCELETIIEGSEPKDPKPGMDHIIIVKGWKPPFDLMNGEQRLINFVNSCVTKGYGQFGNRPIIIPWHRIVSIIVTKKTPKVVQVNWAYEERP
jgi:hypothetical protein